MSSQNSLKILINTAHNFPDFPGVAYFLRYLRAGLDAAGFDVDYSLGFGAGNGTLNILVEPFDDAIAARLLEHKAGHGGDYIVLATEFLTDGTLNAFGDSDDRDGTHYSHSPNWKMRHDALLKAASGAKAVWVTTKAQLPAFQQALPEIPVLPVPLLYARALDYVPAIRPHKYYDVLFSGAQTPYRQEALSRLKGTIPVETPPFLPEMLYQSICAQSRICLHLRLQRKWPFTSVMRHHGLLHSTTYVVSEACDVPGELDAFIDVVPLDRMAGRLTELLSDPELEKIAQRKKADFMRAGTLRQGFLELLSKSFD